MCDNHGVNEKTAVYEFVTKAQYIHIVGDAQVLANLVFLNVGSRDDDDNF